MADSIIADGIEVVNDTRWIDPATHEIGLVEKPLRCAGREVATRIVTAKTLKIVGLRMRGEGAEE